MKATFRGFEMDEVDKFDTNEIRRACQIIEVAVGQPVDVDVIKPALADTDQED